MLQEAALGFTVVEAPRLAGCEGFAFNVEVEAGYMGVLEGMSEYRSWDMLNVRGGISMDGLAIAMTHQCSQAPKPGVVSSGAWGLGSSLWFRVLCKVQV